MNTEKNSPKDNVTLAALGAGLLIVVCCAGPALIAAGALGAVGGALDSPWLLLLGAMAALAAIYQVRRRRHAPRLAKSDDCCQPAAKEDERSR